MTRSQRATEWLIKTILAAAIIAGLLYLAETSLASKKHCENVQCYRAALRWQSRDRHHLQLELAHQQRHDAAYALRLAAAYSGLPLAKLKCVAWRESRMGTQTTPEPRSGAKGLMQFLDSTWAHTPFSAYGFSVWDDVANALAAVQIMAHDGSARQWDTGRGCGL